MGKRHLHLVPAGPHGSLHDADTCQSNASRRVGVYFSAGTRLRCLQREAFADRSMPVENMNGHARVAGPDGGRWLKNRSRLRAKRSAE